MNKRTMNLLLAAGVASSLMLAVPLTANAVTYTESTIRSCGTKYPAAQTTGYTTVSVTVAGGTASASFAYPGSKVTAVGTSHSGYVTSYASGAITSWGYTGCSLQ